jgi:hypothetical protein
MDAKYLQDRLYQRVVVLAVSFENPFGLANWELDRLLRVLAEYVNLIFTLES